MAKAVQIIGDKELEDLFKNLPGKVQRKHTRKGVNKATSLVVKAAKAKAPKESGLLRRSQGKKVKTYTQSGSIVGIVGPRNDVVGEYKGKKRKPSKYAHLVEAGHIDARTGKHVPAKPFLRPAWESTKEQAAKAVQDTIAEGIDKEAKG